MASVRSERQFVYHKDRYNGITIETAEITFSDIEFEETLKDKLLPDVETGNGSYLHNISINQAEGALFLLFDCHFDFSDFVADTRAFATKPNHTSSLNEWLKSGIRGVWFHVPQSKASYIPILVNHGFQFHHAKASYLMLTKWLPSSEPNLLPQYPHTHIGVGGLVVNDKNEVLIIQEKYGLKAYWKFPGGYANPGEDIADTAKREVLEETGIETEFKALILFRHHHKHLFDCSDIYFVCHMTPIGGNIRKCAEEISECRWMNINEFQSHPDISDMNQFVMKSFLEMQRNHTSIGITPVLSFNKQYYQNVYNIIWTKKNEKE